MQVHCFRYFFIPYLLLLILAFTQVLVTNHGATVLIFNEYHTPFLNNFFKVVTYGGDGYFFGVLVICVLIWNRKAGYILLIIGLIEGLTTWILKQVFFSKIPRPMKFFEKTNLLKAIDGVEPKEFHSFPSGHTMMAFAVAVFFALVIRKREWSVILLVIAACVGLSRIYLNHHFLIDVAAGSLIGVFISYLCFIFFEKRLDLKV